MNKFYLSCVFFLFGNDRWKFFYVHMFYLNFILSIQYTVIYMGDKECANPQLITLTEAN